MNIIQVVILGIIEGLTEFLPISSTGHLIIAEKLFGWQSVNEFLTVVLQFGSILAALIFFRVKIMNIAKESAQNISKGNYKNDLGINMLIAIIPTLIIAFLFKNYLDQLQNSTILLALSTIFFGILFYVIERIYSKVKTIELKDVKLKNLLVMGIAQAIAIIPGVSRSGITIAGGLTQNLDIKDSIEISFIMGIPVLFIASFYEMFKSLKTVDSSILVYAIIGIVVSFITGWLGIKATLGWVKKYGFKPFMLYRIFLGVFIIVLFIR